MNKVMLLGRLTRDPDLRFSAGSGTAVTRFTVAVNRPRQKDKQPEADFINCIAFGKAGETIAEYLTKGRQIAISGNIRTGSYEAKDGTKRYTTEVVVETFEFISSNAGAPNETDEYSRRKTALENFESIGNESREDMMPVDDGDIPF